MLGLIAAELLIEHFPSAREGGLAPRLNALVRKETLAAVAEKLGLYAHIRKGAAREGEDSRGRSAILADTCEAVIAALYLDGGLEAARRFVRAHWAPMLARLDEIPRDAKTSLQEWAQARGHTPVYTLLARLGPDHAPSFHVEARVAHYAPAVGEGPSKRAAEQAAAEAFLVREGVWARKAEAESLPLPGAPAAAAAQQAPEPRAPKEKKKKQPKSKR